MSAEKLPALHPYRERLIVIGCGSSKLDHAGPAGDLYTGGLFCSAKRYAVESAEDWVILSGKHGVVLPTTRLEPYDQKVPRGAARQEWAERAAARIAELAAGRSVELLMGIGYTRAVEPVLRERWGVRCSEPLQGMTMGQRLSKLKQMWLAVQ